jgi:hypothetical protein
MSGDWSLEPDAMSYGIAINAYAKVSIVVSLFMLALPINRAAKSPARRCRSTKLLICVVLRC